MIDVANTIRIKRDAWSGDAAEVHRGFGLLSLSLLLLLLVFTFDDPSSAVAWASAVSAVLTAFLALLALHWISFTRDRRHGDQLASQLRPVEDWTVSDVRAWLVSCARSKVVGDDACRSSDGCPRPRSAGLIGAAALRSYADLFAHNFVDGAVLLELTPGDVRALGVPFGHSLKIHAAIAQLAERLRPGSIVLTLDKPLPNLSSGTDQGSATSAINGAFLLAAELPALPVSWGSARGLVHVRI